MPVPLIPLGIGVGARLAYKPAMNLATKLAKKYWKATSDSSRKKIVQEARDKKILEKFNYKKINHAPKADQHIKAEKPLDNIKLWKKSSAEKQKYWEKGFARKAKKEGIDVTGKTKQEMIDTVRAHSKATRPYSPTKKYVKGGRLGLDNSGQKIIQKLYKKGGKI